MAEQKAQTTKQNQVKRVEKVWGSEEWIANNDKYCGKILNLNKGFRCSIHYHKNKHETFYILQGKVLMELFDSGGNRSIINIMLPEKIQVIEPYQRHRFTGLEDSRIIEFSTHHEESDSYRDRESAPVDLDELKQELGIKW